jgi:hypothetical protein
MFSYFSLLVESFVFDVIHVNFLIVGHTHSSIDQYFSVLTGSIKDAAYIASPLGLIELLKIAHKYDNIDKRPTVCRLLTVFYAFKDTILPYIDKDIAVFIHTVYYI